MIINDDNFIVRISIIIEAFVTELGKDAPEQKVIEVQQYVR